MVYDKQRQNAIGARIGVCVFIFQKKWQEEEEEEEQEGQTFHFQFHLVGVFIWT